MLENYVLIYFWQALTTFLNIFFPVSGSAIVNPVVAALSDPYRAIGMSTAIFFLSGLHRVYIFRHNILDDKKNLHYIKIMLPFSIMGAFLGSFLLTNLNRHILTLVILFSSLFFIIKTILALTKEQKPSPATPISLTAIPVAFFTGLLQGSSLPGVDIRNNFLRTQLTEVSVRSVGSAIGLFNFLIVSLVVFIKMKLPYSDIIFVISFIPMLIIAQLAGKHILVKLKDQTAKLLGLSMSVISFLILLTYFLKSL